MRFTEIAHCIYESEDQSCSFGGMELCEGVCCGVYHQLNSTMHRFDQLVNAV